ncbi:hypothetical protein BGZ83_004895 [Gryganskiella cystojenkinii]|nr:hypothetical protein BGZ83_004895 [Gryganskiella cystojenkinii]
MTKTPEEPAFSASTSSSGTIKVTSSQSGKSGHHKHLSVEFLHADTKTHKTTSTRSGSLPRFIGTVDSPAVIEGCAIFSTDYECRGDEIEVLLLSISRIRSHNRNFEREWDRDSTRILLQDVPHPSEKPQDRNKVRIGTHKFSFKWIVDPSLRSSYDLEGAEVKYAIRARVLRSSMFVGNVVVDSEIWIENRKSSSRLAAAPQQPRLSKLEADERGEYDDNGLVETDPNEYELLRELVGSQGVSFTDELETATGLMHRFQFKWRDIVVMEIVLGSKTVARGHTFPLTVRILPPAPPSFKAQKEKSTAVTNALPGAAIAAEAASAAMSSSSVATDIHTTIRCVEDLTVRLHQKDSSLSFLYSERYLFQSHHTSGWPSITPFIPGQGQDIWQTSVQVAVPNDPKIVTPSMDTKELKVFYQVKVLMHFLTEDGVKHEFKMKVPINIIHAWPSPIPQFLDMNYHKALVANMGKTSRMK